MIGSFTRSPVTGEIINDETLALAADEHGIDLSETSVGKMFEFDKASKSFGRREASKKQASDKDWAPGDRVKLIGTGYKGEEGELVKERQTSFSTGWFVKLDSGQKVDFDETDLKKIAGLKRKASEGEPVTIEYEGQVYICKPEHEGGYYIFTDKQGEELLFDYDEVKKGRVNVHGDGGDEVGTAIVKQASLKRKADIGSGYWDDLDPGFKQFVESLGYDRVSWIDVEEPQQNEFGQEYIELEKNRGRGRLEAKKQASTKFKGKLTEGDKTYDGEFEWNDETPKALEPKKEASIKVAESEAALQVGNRFNYRHMDDQEPKIYEVVLVEGEFIEATEQETGELEEFYASDPRILKVSMKRKADFNEPEVGDIYTNETGGSFTITGIDEENDRVSMKKDSDGSTDTVPMDWFFENLEDGILKEAGLNSSASARSKRLARINRVAGASFQIGDRVRSKIGEEGTITSEPFDGGNYIDVEFDGNGPRMDETVQVRDLKLIGEDYSEASLKDTKEAGQEKNYGEKYKLDSGKTIDVFDIIVNSGVDNFNDFLQEINSRYKIEGADLSPDELQDLKKLVKKWNKFDGGDY